MTALARLLEQATPGPWEFRVWGRDGDEWPDSRVSVGTITGHGEAVAISPRYGERTLDLANARLIALAPDMARLLIDAVERHPEDKWLLARFAELEQRAAP